MRRRSACAECPACAAKDQTIALLADLVDWHRAREGQNFGSGSASVAAAPPPLPALEPAGDKPEPTPEEAEIESIITELNYGDIDNERAEYLTARLQTLTSA